MLNLMLRPKWLGFLALALIVATGFVLLSQWQISRSFETGELIVVDTETPRPLTELQEPQSTTTDAAAGHRVTVEGFFVPGEQHLVAGRIQGEETGYWVVGRFQLADSVSLAVARGFAPTLAEAEQAAEALRSEASAPGTLTGRFYPPEPPEADLELPRSVLATMSPVQLVNLWQAVVGQRFYSGYLIDDAAPAGLAAIPTVAPSDEVVLNWMNLVYAGEWILFAAFAVFIWYRAVRDEWLELQEQEAEPGTEGVPAAAAAGADSGAGAGTAGDIPPARVEA